MNSERHVIKNIFLEAMRNIDKDIAYEIIDELFIEFRKKGYEIIKKNKES